MDPRHLVQLATIFECGSISKASHVLHLTQPTLTHNMQMLESKAGGLLFERSRHGVRSTALGEMLAREGRAIARRIRDADEACSRHKSGFARTLRLGVGPLIGAALMPNFLAECAQTATAYAISVQVDRPHLLVDQLVDGRHDFVVAPSWLDKPPPGVERTLLVEDAIGVFCSATHPVISGASLDKPWDWINLGAASPFDQNVREMLADAGFQEARSHITVMGDAYMLLATLAQGRHLSVLPCFPVRKLLHAFGLAELPLPVGTRARDIYIWCRSALMEDESMVAFRDLMVSVANRA